LFEFVVYGIREQRRQRKSFSQGETKRPQVTQEEVFPEIGEGRTRAARRASSVRPGLLVSQARCCRIGIGIGAVAALFATFPALSHEIYTGVTGKDGQLCCGAGDCSPTIYRENGGTFEFLTREHKWVEIPADRITFQPIPGDETPAADAHRAHLCYRPATNFDRLTPYKRGNVFGDIYLWCAFIPPGGV
jgi:hypothetical protein